MQFTDIIYTEKMKAVLRDESQVLFLVGATGCSKSTIAGIKFMDIMYNAPKQRNQFFIVFKDIGTGTRNFLQNKDSFYNVFSFMREEYTQSKIGGLQFVFKGKNGKKIVYLCGANDRTSWSKVLGSNPDGIWLEELSVLHIDLIRELMGRAFSRNCKLLATTNGGLPTQEFYTEFVNHSQVQFSESVPQVELAEMVQDKAYMHYYHFNLKDDAPHLTELQRQNLIDLYPEKSFYYNSKILGVRGYLSGSAFAELMLKEKHLILYENINMNSFEEIDLFIDIGGSKNTQDINKSTTVGSLVGYTKGCQRIVVLESWLAPVNDYDKIIEFYENKIYDYWARYITRVKKIVIDNADSVLVSTWYNKNKYKGTIQVKGCVKTYKHEITLVTRCTLKQQLLLQERLLWTTRAVDNYESHTRLLLDDNGAVKDLATQDNDKNDTIDYALTEKWTDIQSQIRRV